MKKKSLIHPRLFLSINIAKSKIFFKQNKFNQQGERILQESVFYATIKSNEIPSLLLKKNNNEFSNLNKYIKIQKKVLDKYEKARNYDAYQTVESSVIHMEKFQDDFKKWFSNI